jgi:plasmid stabilization system protein ParE
LATLRFTPAALRDLERLASYLRETDPAAAGETIPLILDGLKVLATHPLICRPIAVGRRELLDS